MGYRNAGASRRATLVVLYRLKRKGLVDSVTEEVEGRVAKEMRVFREESSAVKAWMRRLRSKETQEKWLYLFTRYFKWVREQGHFTTPDEMLDNKQSARTDKEHYLHVNLVEDYLAESDLTAPQKKATYSAVRSFYKHSKAALPIYTLEFRETRAKITTQQPITLEEFRFMMDQAKPREKAMFLCALQCALDRSTLCDVFNFEAWSQICKQLGSEDHALWDVSRAPIKISLMRPKTRTVYYNFLSVDALQALQQWLTYRETLTGEKMREGEPLFITIRHTPIGRDRVSNEFTQLAITAGLETKKYGKANEVRYRFHSHELRDTFRTNCTIAGVNYPVAEFFLGHSIDKLGYDKSPEVDVEHFRSQYRLVEPYVNVLSRQSVSTKKVEELEQKITERDSIVQALLNDGKSKDERVTELEKKLETLEDDVVQQVLARFEALMPVAEKEAQEKFEKLYAERKTKKAKDQNP
jgi:hypothetical protein